jgi:hypothetical protein
MVVDQEYIFATLVTVIRQRTVKILMGHNSLYIGKPFISPEKMLVAIDIRLVYIRRRFTMDKGKLSTTRITMESKSSNLVI